MSENIFPEFEGGSAPCPLSPSPIPTELQCTHLLNAVLLAGDFSNFGYRLDVLLKSHLETLAERQVRLRVQREAKLRRQLKHSTRTNHYISYSCEVVASRHPICGPQIFWHSAPTNCCIPIEASGQGRSGGGYMGIYTPKSVQVKFFGGRNDVRTAIEHEYYSFIPPKKNLYLQNKFMATPLPVD